MRAVLQRVTSASVRVEGREVAAIGPGVLVLLGVAAGDGEAEADRLAERVARLRFFRDEEDRMNRSVLDCAGSALVVSQFTLAADTRSGRRPSFDGAARPEVAEPLYERFVAALRALGVPAATGVFGARMQVALENDGPVTFVVDEPAGRER